MICFLVNNRHVVTIFSFFLRVFLGNSPLKLPTTPVEKSVLSPSTICNFSSIKHYVLFPLSQLTIWKLT